MPDDRKRLVLPATPGTCLYEIYYLNHGRAPETFCDVRPVIGWREVQDDPEPFFEPIVPFEQPRYFGGVGWKMFLINTPDGKYREVSSDGDCFDSLDDAAKTLVARAKRLEAARVAP